MRVTPDQSDASMPMVKLCSQAPVLSSRGWDPIQTLSLSDATVRCAGDQCVKLWRSDWEASRGEVQQTYRGHEKHIVGLGTDQSMRHLYTASFDKMALEWDVETGKQITRFEGHTDGKLLLSCCSLSLRILIDLLPVFDLLSILFSSSLLLGIHVTYDQFTVCLFFRSLCSSVSRRVRSLYLLSRH